jgi:flagellar protein FliO/FliZ
MDAMALLRALLALVFVLGLIGVVSLLLKKYGHKLLSSSHLNSNKSLKVIESTPIDARNRMVLVQRDNVRHLLLISGQQTTVIETNIISDEANQ